MLLESGVGIGGSQLWSQKKVFYNQMPVQALSSERRVPGYGTLYIDPWHG